MDPAEFFTGGGRPSPRKELQGPRPAPLKVNKDSHKIRKPPVAPQLHHPPQQPHLPPPAAANNNRQPVVIYTVSPKVIHTTVNDFMNLVQRLTGPSPRAGNTPTAGAGDVSPAARLASVELVSPSERERERQQRAANEADDLMEILEGTSFETGQIPGILTPEPATLPPASIPGLFSPAPDPFLNGSNMFIPSPSFLLSSPLISPSLSSSYDLFNSFFDL
ncbi:OLC1v1008720C1 [Oldenlandia corymbosa var. corymbosa]|uniref:OLC1v1008720C1 n=1 Tax=Oldenlandia corymbosa var. corymbosa TaxID=529605 RepID=A0AAV1DPR8_OLDCO|nr:OLC1v1008720C1 [Oldenlandia corymbosa var. corymbosa]